MRGLHRRNLSDAQLRPRALPEHADGAYAALCTVELELKKMRLMTKRLLIIFVRLLNHCPIMLRRFCEYAFFNAL